jgi:hypothetical protein
VTVTDTVAASFVAMTSVCAASAAEVAVPRRDGKNTEISRLHLFPHWPSKLWALSIATGKTLLAS